MVSSQLREPVLACFMEVEALEDSRVNVCRKVVSRPSSEMEQPLKDLLLKQTAEGWFDWDPDADGADGREGAVLERAEAEKWLQAHAARELAPVERERVIRTLMAVYRLYQRFRFERISWMRARAKAIEYVARAAGLEDASALTYFGKLSRPD